MGYNPQQKKQVWVFGHNFYGKQAAGTQNVP